MKRKITIFLTVVKVATIRDILMNGVFEDFRFDVHFVIFTHFKLSSELTSLFNGYSVEFIKIPPANTDSFKIQFFRKIRTFIYHLRNCTPTSDTKMFLLKEGYFGSKIPLAYYTYVLLKKIKSPLKKKFLNLLSDFFFRLELFITKRTDLRYARLIDKYKPLYVFSHSPYDMIQLPLHRSAFRAKVPLVASIVSWDNPTSSGELTIPFSDILVWSDHMKEEVHTFLDYDYSKLHVSGALQFDQYFKIKPESKLQFYRKFNIPLNKKIITYTMTSSLHQPKEHEIIIIISEILRDYFPDCVLLVRGYPNNPNNGMFDSLSKKYSFFFDDPAKSEMVGEKYFPSKDYLRNLISTMKYSLCTINYPSTIILDASIFLKPTINLKFDTHEEKKGFSPAKRFYNYLHFRYVTESNASIVVNNKKELINGIRAILKNPDLKKNELLSFRDKICGPVDGKAYLRQRKILQQLSEKYLSLRSL